MIPFDHVKRSWLFTVAKKKLSSDGQTWRLIEIIEGLYYRVSAGTSDMVKI